MTEIFPKTAGKGVATLKTACYNQIDEEPIIVFRVFIFTHNPLIHLVGVDTMKKKKGRNRKMATQLAPTPMLRGQEAKEVLKQASVKMNAQSKAGAQKLTDKFSKLVRKS